MQYRLNGVDLPEQPTEAGWVDQASLGEDGNGHPIYPELYEFEMSWGVLEPGQWTRLYDFFFQAGLTGTVSATLQCYTGIVVDEAATYSGCIVRQPTRGKVFSGFILNSKVVLGGIRVR